MTRGDPRVEIGGVARAHGIRGEVIVVTHDPATEVAAFPTLWIDGAAHTVTSVRGNAKGWIVAIEGITDRTTAERFKGQPVEVDRELLELSDEDVLLADLVGCTVKLADGTVWGTIFAVDAGLQDLLVIHHENVERLIPLVDEFVKEIDLEAGVVIVDPPEGLPENPL